ncbi:hypothetical protein [uncultured Sphingomonas sp.]|uniref:hypothetical protein n=1 Tax=uncultured Sphingomonas sp. TaxID=158754 RepID=UPI0025D3DD49|nr:hypothetical protein [uncultured Sphingomonas sp.]
MLTAIALLLAQTAPADCSYDRAAMLTLDLRGFDQDTGGWRNLSMRGCEAQAADLIRDYRTANAVPPDRIGLLYWHEGQLRANLGETAAAIALFEKAYKTPEQDRGFGWNLYVDGSIAFLRRDRAALDTARDALAVVPRPTGLDLRGPDGKPIAIRWPMNLNVLDGFQRCWDQPYKTAYVCPPTVGTTPAAR